MNDISTQQTLRDEIAAKAARLVALDAEIKRMADEALKLGEEREQLIRWFEGRTSAPAEAVALNGERARARGQNPGSFAAALVSHLEASPERIFTIAEIHKEVGPDKSKRRIRSALFDLVNRKPPQIERVKDGHYRAVRKEAPA